MGLKEKAEELARAIEGARRIGVLTGAGISTGAGIPDFRGPKGIYRTLKVENPEAIFDIRRFNEDPSEFYRFHRGLMEMMLKAEPTFTHRFLAGLEGSKKVTVITQNVDGLHQRAGSKDVIEIHGGITHNFCSSCGKSYSIEELRQLMDLSDVPRCSCSGTIRPDIVFFGEPVKQLERCFSAASESDLMMVIGSSLNVTPAALIPSSSKGVLAVVNLGEVNTFNLHRRVDIMAEDDIDRFFKRVSENLKNLA
ncbi:NAD-dependent protein deacetylase, SIR2 family [Thermanaerovibrio velox DSM 12556]|uniref:protein acetyllysine N-acetyltransferase n=1 Tax=Thermanaerovibrio velox DSM 12556 TaxID=926567 RepID=H0UP47_9BACT|nr:Sir2 family NAD-dependent protein deacetylase [Thermanaerovibrio velox]EHM10550.1 NAD-dependent protein deacetylase, SIR2 family [Thermanaerovibrio velox DSM 12556]